MNSERLVIAGGGLAAARAIKSYREAGAEGRITLVAEEATLPYHRPALSKKYLRGELTETPHVEEGSFYRDHDVDVLLGRRVASVDSRARAVELDGHGRLVYDRLLLVTGASPRRLPVPGGDLEGVFSLRTVRDSGAIRHAAGAGERALVVGGGFIGMEAAASLRQLGLEVTLIHQGRGLFDGLGSQELSEALAELYEEHGVELLFGRTIAGFGGDRALTHAETTDGQRIAADLAVVGIGVVPNTDFLAGSGVTVDSGIVVDERFETSTPGVFAAGDVARFFDPLYGRHRRIEHWSNASYQGSEVGKILAGAEGGYETVSSFFSEVFGTTIKVFGDVTEFDSLSADGSLGEGFLATYSSRGRVVGALTVGQGAELEAHLEGLIARRAPSAAVGYAPLAA